MRRLLLKRTGIAIGTVVLLASLAPLTQTCRHEAAWRVLPDDERYVDRALTGGAAFFGLSRDDYRRITRPHVVREQDRTCVTLETHRSDGGGSYTGCFDIQTGDFVSEVARGGSFGGESLWDRFGPWYW